MSTDNEILDDEIISADDLLAVADYEWHVTTIMGKKYRQRALDVSELFAAYKEFPDVEKLLPSGGDDEDLSPEEEAVKTREFIKEISENVMGIGRKATAHLVAVSLGKGEDAKYKAALIKMPEQVLVEGLTNLLNIMFSEGGVAGFFTKRFGRLVEAGVAAGLTPAAIARMMAAGVAALAAATDAVSDATDGPATA